MNTYTQHKEYKSDKSVFIKVFHFEILSSRVHIEDIQEGRKVEQLKLGNLEFGHQKYEIKEKKKRSQNDLQRYVY